MTNMKLQWIYYYNYLISTILQYIAMTNMKLQWIYYYNCLIPIILQSIIMGKYETIKWIVGVCLTVSDQMNDVWVLKLCAPLHLSLKKK